MMIHKRLISLCSESKKYIVYTVLANWTAAICNIMIILWMGKMVNTVYHGLVPGNRYLGDFSFLGLRNDFLIVLVLMGIRLVANLLASKFSAQASAAAKIKLRDMIYEKLLKLGLDYQGTTSTSSVVQAAIEGVEALEIYFGKYLPQLFYAVLAPITLFAVISFISFRTALVFILCVPLIPISIVAVIRIAKKVLKTYWNSYTNLGETFLDNLQGLTTLKVFQADEERHKKMNGEAEQFRRITMKVLTMQLNSITVMDLIAYGGAAVGTITALYSFRAGNIEIGQVIVIILLSSEFFIPLRLLGSFFHVAMNGMAASDKIFALLDTAERIKAEEFAIAKAEAAALFRGYEAKGEITVALAGVTFGYEDTKDVLYDVSMAIPKNSFTAIVGESGSGKSTIAAVLLGMYPVHRGGVYVKGMPIAAMDPDEIYDTMVLISTNTHIFNGTLRENLMIGKKDASGEEIATALRQANLESFVATLEAGLDTNVGEGGSLLSGGQKQRLALARAILSDREVMVFDEATSNIDVESEEMIWRSIYELAKEKTVIVISHRLANVVHADHIYVMDKGRLVEEGTHETLMNQKGKYFQMTSEQSLLEGRRE